MSDGAAVDLRFCVAMISTELAGYKGYPKNDAGESRFGRALQSAAISVEHARAILAEFTNEFPSVQQIIDTGLNLRPKFESTISQREQWEREYGKAAPVLIDWDRMSGQQQTSEMWRQLKVHFTKVKTTFPGWAAISWREIYEAQDHFGFPLNRDQLKMLGR